jgi:hypothetical protein
MHRSSTKKMLKYMNQFIIKNITGRRKQKGVTLLIIIIGMLVVAVLGIALYALTYTATLNQVIAQRAARAFYLAESGIRIAASEYKAATAANKNAQMIALHQKIFTMPDTVSTIQIQVYPYWLYADAATATTLYLPGGAPPIDDTSTTPIIFPATGLLKIEDVGRSPAWEGSNMAVYSNATISPSFDPAKGTMVTFTFSTPFPSPIIAGDEFYIGYSYNSTDSEANPGGDLILNVDDDNKATMFPPQKGTILVAYSAAISQYSYDSRIITTTSTPHTVRFTNIQAITGAPSPQWPLTIINGREIYVGKSVGFRSASEYGQ